MQSGSVTINPVAIITNQVNTYCSSTSFTRTLVTGNGITVPANTTYSLQFGNAIKDVNEGKYYSKLYLCI